MQVQVGKIYRTREGCEAAVVYQLRTTLQYVVVHYYNLVNGLEPNEVVALHNTDGTHWIDKDMDIIEAIPLQK